MSYIERENEILRKAVGDAKKKIAEQDEVLQQLLAQPTVQGVVVSIRGSRVLVSCPPGLVEVEYPRAPVDGKDLSRELRNGSAVRMIIEPKPAIIDILKADDWFGDIALAAKEGKGGECEVEIQGSTRIIRVASNIKNPEPGDRLLMDDKFTIAMRNLGPDESKFSYQGGSKVSWDDIGGLLDAKRILIESIELPHQYPDLFKKYNKKQVKGVLLYGPPGCGKTMLGKATASSLAKSHGKEAASTGFIYVKGPEILDKYVGNSEAVIRGLFSRARKHQKKHGYPAVVFIDEGDAILGKRGARPNMGIESTTVPQFLSEMDGLDETGPIVLIATNRPDSLDSAVTRDGRVDQKVQVTRPDYMGTVDIFKLYLKNVPLAANVSMGQAAEFASELMYNQKYQFYKLFKQDGSSVSFTLSGLLNGAMIAGVVEKASMQAMNRDIANLKLGKKKPQGVTMDDIRSSIESTYTQNKHLNHEMEVQEFVEDNQLAVERIIKVQQQQANAPAVAPDPSAN